MNEPYIRSYLCYFVIQKLSNEMSIKATIAAWGKIQRIMIEVIKG